MLIVHDQPMKPLWVTVTVPPKESSHPMEAHVDFITAMARLKELPEGTRYASVKVKGNVLEAITPPDWKVPSTRR